MRSVQAAVAVAALCLMGWTSVEGGTFGVAEMDLASGTSLKFNSAEAGERLERSNSNQAPAGYAPSPYSGSSYSPPPPSYGGSSYGGAGNHVDYNGGGYGCWEMPWYAFRYSAPGGYEHQHGGYTKGQRAWPYWDTCPYTDYYPTTNYSPPAYSSYTAPAPSYAKKY